MTTAILPPSSLPAGSAVAPRPRPSPEAPPERRPRRLSPPLYRLALVTHLAVSVSWLGVVLAKLVLGLAAVTAAPGAAAGLYLALGALNVAFPPLAIATVVSGVALSLGTRWGLLRHTWVVTKLLLTVGVIATAVRVGDGVVQGALAGPPGPVLGDGTLAGLAAAPAVRLLALTVAHLLMLALATVLSVYKPWGRSWLGRRGAP
jgi:hypothetical protein